MLDPATLQEIMRMLMRSSSYGGGTNPLANAINGAMSNPWLEMGSPLSPSEGLPSREQFGAMNPEQRMGATNKYYSFRNAIWGEHQRRLQEATQMGRTPTTVSGPGTSLGGTYFSPGYK